MLSTAGRLVVGAALVALPTFLVVGQLRSTAALGRVEGSIGQVRDSLTLVIESPVQYHKQQVASMIQLVKMLCHPEDGQLTITSILGTNYDGAQIPNETREQLRDRHRAEIAHWEAQGYTDC